MAVIAVGLPAGAAQATFPGTNGRIAFERSTVPDAHDIYSTNPDGSAQLNLTHNGANNRQVAWSPDGSHIAFRSDGDGFDDYYDIHVARADGLGPPVRISTTTSASDAAWAPDGRSILFADGFIYSVRSDGTGLRVLVGTGRFSIRPAWSPDGSKISFGHYDGRSGGPHIYVANADGSDMRRISADEDIETYGWSRWSPDGTRIVYFAALAGCQPFGCRRVYVVNADGTNRRAVSSLYGVYPTWSPDGSKIAFQGFRSGAHQIYTVNPDGTGETQLTNSSRDNYGPEWSPDSTQVVFSRATDNTQSLDVHVVNRDGSGDRRVTDGSGPQWQSIPHPKDAKRLCKAERSELGNKAFRARYGNYGGCVARRA